MTYTLKLYRDKKVKEFKDVKGHLFPEDTAKHIVLIILEDETRILINMNNYDYLEVPKEVFYDNVKRANEESQGKAQIK